MGKIDWTQIRSRAAAFAKKWQNGRDEDAQAQSFLRDFFQVFGVDSIGERGFFEVPVPRLDGTTGSIDCLYPGHLLVEMKSAGLNLDKAYAQAGEYVAGLRKSSPKDAPKAVLVCDFQTFRFYDFTRSLAPVPVVFPLAKLHKYVVLFGDLLGGESAATQEQDPVNRLAAEHLARLHDQLRDSGYVGNDLEVLLVRIVFCLFAEDAEIFAANQFTEFIANHTAEDGRDLGSQLALLFDTLDRRPEKRQTTLDPALAAFPYVDGGLFAFPLGQCAFTAVMRQTLLDAALLDWSKISPAIFGAMFQGVMDKAARRELGAHYTSEENILKLIRPLFLDGLRAELDRAKSLHGPARRDALGMLHEKLARLTFLDPACGCGNFLVVAYQKLRDLELDLIAAQFEDEKDQTALLDVAPYLKITVDQFYGIELEPFPAEIARSALWLRDHLCNLKVGERFGRYYARIPITSTPHIQCADALTVRWPRTNYILGNPPFSGARMMTPEQKQGVVATFGDFPGVGNLDFVTCWYKKASDNFVGGGAEMCIRFNEFHFAGRTAWPALAPYERRENRLRLSDLQVA